MIILNHLGRNLKFVHLCHSMVFLTIWLWAFPVSISRNPHRIRPTCNLPTAVVNSLASLHGTFGSSTNLQCGCVNMSHIGKPSTKTITGGLITIRSIKVGAQASNVVPTSVATSYMDSMESHPNWWSPDCRGSILVDQAHKWPKHHWPFCNKGILSHGESECFKGSKRYTDWLCFVVTLCNQPP